MQGEFSTTRMSNAFTRDQRKAMENLKWSKSEKEIARCVFDRALIEEKDKFIAQFKSRTSRIDDVSQIWEVVEWAERKARYIDTTYRYRYSQLITVFAHLIAERKVNLEELQGLSPDKIESIKRFSEFIRTH